MAKNIYDLFNERKYGVDYLVEGYDMDIEDIDAFESLEEAVYALEDITQESANEAIELQAAWYLEDLVIESMMYNDFNEEQIQGVMEGAIKEKAHKAAEYIKRKWQQIKEWFVSTFKAIANFFQNGESLVIKHRKEIPGKVRNCHVKMKMPDLEYMNVANNKCHEMVVRLKAARKAKSKEQVLSAVGASDKKEVGKKVKAVFFKGDSKEKSISQCNPDMLMKWAEGKKQAMDDVKKQQKETDAFFKETLSDLKEAAKGKEGDAAKAANEHVANFNFAWGIANTVLSTQIACIREVGKMCTAIIRKALAKGVGTTGLDANDAAYAAQDKADKERGLNTQKALPGPKTESFVPTFEALEFYEEEEYDDWDW